MRHMIGGCRPAAYAALFATARSFDEDQGHLISPQDMTDEERQAVKELKQELTHLRNTAMRPAPLLQSLRRSMRSESR